MTYRRKLKTVSAVQYHRGIEDGIDCCNDTMCQHRHGVSRKCHVCDKGMPYIIATTGSHRHVRDGDFIVNGEYVMAAKRFLDEYEETEEWQGCSLDCRECEECPVG